MNARWLAAVGAAMVLSAGPALAQKVPENASEVARPGGTIAGRAEDRAREGGGRLQRPGRRIGRERRLGPHLRRRARRPRQGRRKDGKVNAEPFLDLTNINPLGSDVQTGFVEQGLWSIAFHPKFKENGHFFVHYASLPFNGASMVVRFTVDPSEPGRALGRADHEDRQGADEHPAALLQPLRRHDRLRAGRQALRRQGRRRLGGRPARRRPAPRHASRQDAAHRRRHAGRRSLRGAEGQPVRQGRQAAADVAVRHHRAGLRQDQDRRRSPRSGPTACATRTCSTSTRPPATSSSPMSGRTTGRRSTGSRPRPRAARTTAGS